MSRKNLTTAILMLGYAMDPHVTSLMGMLMTIIHGFIQFGPLKSMDDCGEDTETLFHIAGLCLPLWLNGSYLVAFCGFSTFVWDCLSCILIGRQWSFFNRKFPESEKRLVNVAFSYAFQVVALIPSKPFQLKFILISELDGLDAWEIWLFQ